MKNFLNNFNKKDFKLKIFYIILGLTFIQLVINIVSLIKDNFSILIIVCGVIIVVGIIKKN